MKSFFNKLKWMLLFIAIAIFLDKVFLSGVLMSVSAGIVNLFVGGRLDDMEETYSFLIRMLLYVPLTIAYFSLFACLPWRLVRVRSSEGRREYLEKLDANVFDRKLEKRNCKKDKEFRKEIWAYVLTNVLGCIVFLLINVRTEDEILALYGFIISLPFNILVFWLFDRKFYVDLREAWADERIRLNPNPPRDDG